MKQFTHQIQVPQGLHARPAGLVVKLAKTLSSAMTIEKDGTAIQASRLFALMGLNAGQGDMITVSLEGPQEAEELPQVQTFFRTHL